MQSLSDEQRSAGVIAMSAGNHAQAVAYHAGQMGIPAVIVMPSQTPFAKIARTRAYGAEVVLEGRNLNDCESKVQALIDSRGLTLIHPYDNNEVMIGQGTVGLEMLIDQPDLDVLVVPIGGGGLVGGIATIAKEMRPDIRIIGVQTEAYPSMHAAMLGRDIVCGGETLAEGIAVKKPGGVTLPVVQALVDKIVLVNEKHLEWAVSGLVEQQRIVAEGAGAAGIAAIYAHPQLFKGLKVGVVICGGNIDPRLLSSILNRNMAIDGRIARLRIDISDEPGMLAAITESIGRCGGNIIEIYHQRLFFDVPAKLAKIDAVVETRGPEHIDEIIADLRNRKFTVRRMEEMGD
tara:strand:- start:1980 stop:3020 length:1041 start_codon:yes stop_codon:yes gene_type:complete